MPALLLRDGAFWRARLARRLRRRLADLADHHPLLLARARRLARQRALQALGLASVQHELDAIAAQRRALARRERRAHRAMLALVRRVPLAQVAGLRFRGPHPEVRAALRRRRRACEAEVLAEDEVGREVLRLRRERAALAETLALARAGPRWRRWWRRALALLGQEPTPLQDLVAPTPPAPPPAAR